MANGSACAVAQCTETEAMLVTCSPFNQHYLLHNQNHLKSAIHILVQVQLSWNSSTIQYNASEGVNPDCKSQTYIGTQGCMNIFNAYNTNYSVSSGYDLSMCESLGAENEYWLTCHGLLGHIPQWDRVCNSCLKVSCAIWNMYLTSVSHQFCALHSTRLNSKQVSPWRPLTDLQNSVNTFLPGLGNGWMKYYTVVHCWGGQRNILRVILGTYQECFYTTQHSHCCANSAHPHETSKVAPYPATYPCIGPLDRADKRAAPRLRGISD